MARRSTRSASPTTSRPATPWALLWLAGMAGATWLPLLVGERLPQPQPSTPLAAASFQEAPPAVSHPIPPTPIPLGGSSSSSPGQVVSATQEFNGEPPARPTNSTSPLLRASAEMAGFPVSPPATPTIRGSILLGGPLGLESLKERPMVPAARMEQALRASSSDRLEAVPLQWRSAMKNLLSGPERVLPAEVVRLPAAHLRAPEDYPMVVKSDGVAETTVTPSPDSKQTLERWAERHSPIPEGTVRPYVVVLEPIEKDPPKKDPPLPLEAGAETREAARE